MKQVILDYLEVINPVAELIINLHKELDALTELQPSMYVVNVVSYLILVIQLEQELLNSIELKKPEKFNINCIYEYFL